MGYKYVVWCKDVHFYNVAYCLNDPCLSTSTNELVNRDFDNGQFNGQQYIQKAFLSGKKLPLLLKDIEFRKSL